MIILCRFMHATDKDLSPVLLGLNATQFCLRYRYPATPLNAAVIEHKEIIEPTVYSIFSILNERDC